MSSAQSSSSRGPSQAYYTMPDLHTSTPSDAGTWTAVTVIDDNDLMFGGKSLSAWYEEDRSQQGASSDVKVDHERRGRSRERHRSHHHHHHHHNHHNQGHNGSSKP
jgi:hypothetical protein